MTQFINNIVESLFYKLPCQYKNQTVYNDAVNGLKQETQEPALTLFSEANMKTRKKATE